MTQPKRPLNLTPWLVALVIALIFGNLFLRGVRQTYDPRIGELFRSETSSRTPARAAESPVTVSRPGEGNTPPLTLAGGAYDVSVTTEKACFHTFTLRSLEGGNAADLASTTDAGTRKNTVYAVPAGEYYVAAITGPDCPWALTMTPR